MRRIVALAMCLLGCCWSTAAQSEPSSPNPAPVTPAATSAPVPPLVEAERLYRADKYKDALRNFEQALKQDVKLAAAYEGAVRTCLKLDLVQQAWTTAQEGVKQAPEQSLTHSAMGEVLFRKGKIEEAQREFVKAYNMNEQDARAPYGLHRVYRSASYYGRAKEMLETAHAIDPQDPDIHGSWMAHRPRKERIAWLEKKFVDEEDKKVRARLQRSLAIYRSAETEPHPCRLATKLTETIVPLKVLMPDPQTMEGVEIKVVINGKPMYLLLDTGASGILLKQFSAGGAGLAPALQVPIAGAGDEKPLQGYLSYADSIKVGELEYQNCVVAVADTSGRHILSSVDGIIGADVFASYLVSIDFPGEKLALKQLPTPPGQAVEPMSLITASEVSSEDDSASHDRYVAPEMRNYTPFFRFGHFMLIPTKVGDTEPRLFMIDSGAFSSSIATAVAREQTRVFHDLDLQVEGLSGQVKTIGKAAGRAVLRFGHVAQENVNMWSMDESDLSHALGTEVSGTLGYTALAFMQMDIDYRDGLVNFTYDPKKYRPLMRWKQQGKD